MGEMNAVLRAFAAVVLVLCCVFIAKLILLPENAAHAEDVQSGRYQTNCLKFDEEYKCVVFDTSDGQFLTSYTFSDKECKNDSTWNPGYLTFCN
jgi:hypothetical protein